MPVLSGRLPARNPHTGNTITYYIRMKKAMLLSSLLTLMPLHKLNANGDNGTDKYDSRLLPAGEQAPDFTITNGQYPQGIALSSFKGKLVVLEFWASWCPDCRKITPTMTDLHKKYSPKDVVFIGVSFDTDRGQWQNYTSKNGMCWLQYSELKKWKKETTVDTLYKVNWIPTMYLIGRDGRIVLGTASTDKLAKALEETE